MPVHAVLVQRDEQVNPVTHIGDFFRAGANRQEGMAATDYGLVGVVSIQIQTASAKDFCEDVTRRSDTLPSCSSNPDSEGLLHIPSLAASDKPTSNQGTAQAQLKTRIPV